MKKKTFFDSREIENKVSVYFENTFSKLEEGQVSIIMPPPNITGELHFGHFWNLTLQDFLLRYYYFHNYHVKSFLGVDHAGIAGQRKILTDFIFSSENLSRSQLFKWGLLWKEKITLKIIEQWKKSSLFTINSEKNLSFTLDSTSKKIADEAFIKLYNDGLIYRGKRIINWDPKIKTAISDLEVIYKTVKTKLYYIRYPFYKKENEYIVVATTRPETIFVDEALVVNPLDKRYLKYHYLKVLNPINKKVIKIITSSKVDKEFGTGVMKCTPFHDEVDYEIALEHNLKFISCLNNDGTMNENACIYQGIDRFVCRSKIISDLQAQDLVEKIVPYETNVSFSERSGVELEHLLSEQWFLKMKHLAEIFFKNQSDSTKKINFFPSLFEDKLFSWLKNVKDWCISRQIWWGHNLPVWKNTVTGEENIVFIKPPTGKEKLFCRTKEVYDTWFMSSLWPLVVTSRSKKNYLPTTFLVTAYDILNFWVTRMVVQSLFLKKKNPFKNVIIHGLVRDISGKKMSKTLNNGIDPLVLIEKYGVDVVRWFVISSVSLGSDFIFSEKKIVFAKKLVNKIWNVFQFAKHNEIFNTKIILFSEIKTEDLTIFDFWILEKLLLFEENVQEICKGYRFDFFAKQLKNFFWNDFCDWYLEFYKNFSQQQKTKSKKLFLFVFQWLLRYFHYYLPHTTTFCFKELTTKSIFSFRYSRGEKFENSRKAIKASFITEALIQIVKDIRNFKQFFQKKIKKQLQLFICCDQNFFLEQRQNFNFFLGKLSSAEITEIFPFDFSSFTKKQTLFYFHDFFKVGFFLDSFDKKEISSNLLVEIKKLQKEIIFLEKNLSNKFIFEKLSQEDKKNFFEKLIFCKKEKNFFEKQVSELSKKT